MTKPNFFSDEEMGGTLFEMDDDFSSGSDEEFCSDENEDIDNLISNFDSDSDASENEDEVDEKNNLLNVDPLFVSKDGKIWNPEPVQQKIVQHRNENVITLHAGVTSSAKAAVNNIVDSFLLFFPPQVERIIIKSSNICGLAKHGDNHIEIDSNLLHAYIGVLILSGVYRSNNEATAELFDDDYGRAIFRSIMSKKTFNYLNKVIRFDDVMGRMQLKSSDKFAPIRDLFMKWSELLPDFYNPHECVTVDEQLLGFRGPCSFRQYMPSKSVKYGLKFWLLVCSKTCYVWKIQPYLGKQINTSEPKRKQVERVVLDLIDGLKGHNVTMNNFFSSYELGQKLLAKELTMVGTIKKNKRSIPPKLLECKKIPLYKSAFAFTNNTALVSYIGRKNKCTILQSTLHCSPDIGSEPKKLPAIIDYYNKTKGGIDTVDKMVSCYSCKRNTKSWPMAVLSNIIDISALNAYIIFNEVDPSWQTSQNTTNRRNFLRQLALELAEPYMSNRIGIPRVSSMFAKLSDKNMDDDTDEEIPPQKRSKSVPPQAKGRKRCHMCYTEEAIKKNNVHETICCLCKQGCCKAHHNRNICIECFSENLI